MLLVTLALLPGTIVMTWFFGAGVLINMGMAAISCMLCESLVLLARKRQVIHTLADGSAGVTGALLGLCLPPELPLWIIPVGCFFAIVVAKQLYGGLGHNLFNPAMTGYAVLILSFPLALSTWPETELNGNVVGSGIPFDGLTAATPLDAFRHKGDMQADTFMQQTDNLKTITQWRVINVAFMITGLLLLWLRVAQWRAPISMLITLCVLGVLFYDEGSSASLGSPLFHLFSGATMLAAFFIVTDPVTSPDSRPGQWLFGAGTGGLIFLMRATGAYPDGVAFAVLLMNAFAPLLDQLFTKRSSS